MGTVSSLRVLLCVPLRNLRTSTYRLNTLLQSAELTQPIALASGNSQIRFVKCGHQAGGGSHRRQNAIYASAHAD